jgi:hypothetical protein
MNVHPLFAVAALAMVASCTSVAQDATRSNCKVSTEELDLRKAAVFEFKAARPTDPVPAALANPLASATITTSLVCG